MIQEKQENGEKYLSVETEDEFHEALQRDLPIQVTYELARKIGLTSEDVGEPDEIIEAHQDRAGILASPIEVA